MGITTLSQSQPCMTQLLVSRARSRTTCPFAAVEVRSNLPLPMSRDLQCLSGTCQIIIAVEPGSMTIWCQGRRDIPKEVRPGVTVGGGMISVKPGQPIEVLPQLWKQVDLGNVSATYLICSTPRGLHKLVKGQRDALLAAGFSGTGRILVRRVFCSVIIPILAAGCSTLPLVVLCPSRWSV